MGNSGILPPCYLSINIQNHLSHSSERGFPPFLKCSLFLRLYLNLVTTDSVAILFNIEDNKICVGKCVNLFVITEETLSTK